MTDSESSQQTLPTTDPANQNTSFSQKAKFGKIITITTYTALIVSLSVHHMLSDNAPSILLWAFKCLPLLVFWPWLRVNSPRGYIGLCFISLLYFIKGVEGVMTPNVDAWDVSLLLLSINIFVFAMMTSRWIQRARLEAPENI